MTGGNGGGGPLAGVRVLEVTHFLAGPYCGMLLGDLGADVIKIESAEGDVGRQTGPHSIGAHNAYFASLNRNKRGICLDLASEEGRERLGELAAGAHALITNLRPAAITKLGLTYEALKKWNPKLVCVALTGYGLEGSHAKLPSYDYVVQALTGFMYLSGEPEAAPTRVGYSVADNTTGIMAALGLLAKIVEGNGGQVDVSLYDTMLSQANYLAGALLNAGEQPRRYPLGGHPYFVPAQLFRTREGWLCLFITHDEFWRRFAEEVGRPEWCEEPHFATMAARLENRTEVVEAVSSLLKERYTDDWVALLAPRGIVISGVHSMQEALDSDLAAEREMVVSMEVPEGPIRAVGTPIKLSDFKPTYRRPPLLGEHTEEVLGVPRKD
jgi:crotonobetainyl-CoA:carnitine CoA-transferase CaiB-like acyl-CoA transferase